MTMAKFLDIGFVFIKSKKLLDNFPSLWYNVDTSREGIVYDKV